MNVFDRASHTRKGRKRGVSPIIATILLVAITVVLAAVLYVLVSGLTKTSTSTPYELGMAETGSTTGTTDIVFVSLTPTTGLTTTMFGLSITTPGGSSLANVAVPAACANGVAPATCVGVAAGWYAILINTGGKVAATYGNATPVWGNLAGAGTIALNGGYTMDILTTSIYAGTSDTLSAYGTGTSSVSGSAIL